MCGIAGCVGHEGAIDFVLDGLDKMEERGYDSAGLVYPAEGLPELKVIKAVGVLANLRVAVPAETSAPAAALGHTRWATHGAKTVENAHPQVNADGTIAVVHNGVIVNHAELRQELEELGYSFRRDEQGNRTGSDTEVVPHLLDRYINEGQEPEEAFNKTVRRLEGANAVLAYFGIEPDTIYAARRDANPLHMGVRGNARYVASMREAIRETTRWIDPLGKHEMARLSSDPSRYKTWELDGRISTRAPQKDTTEIEEVSKGEYQHWMLAEIYSAPETIREAIRGRILPEEGIVKLGGLEDHEVQEKLKAVNRLSIVAMGTSYHAGLIGERLFQEIAGLPVKVHDASEFIDQTEPLDLSTAVIGISQSGETIDTIKALHKAKEFNAELLTLGINNSPGSEMEAITDAGVHCRAKKEKSVASTKAFISQVTILAEMALAMAKENTPLRRAIMGELCLLPGKIEQVLANQEAIQAAAKKYANSQNFLYLGRGYEYVSAMEGALKLKEISYIHAEAYSAGQMKHGPIALIAEDFPTFAIATDSPVYEKTISNINEIKSRGGPVIALATEGNNSIHELVDDVLYVPASLEQTQPILNAVAL
ncbi:MAG TPA: glutamine--fructose-6-phosphate transaminase (isomerizing), partial [Candidatus Saccharimonadales bacterium]|nr:glutamine--fructose-6-phosphate transaminase (isomerizing) [Candidatus Saccharimonadales bacterium]